MVAVSWNCLPVIDEIQAIRSPSSVSGLRFNFTIRLPAGNFLQVLKSFSPISCGDPVTPGVPGAAGAAPGVAAGAPGAGAAGAGTGWGRPRLPLKPGIGKPGSVRGVPGAGGAGTAAGLGPVSPGLTFTGLPSGPVTTAARSGLAPMSTATTTATF